MHRRNHSRRVLVVVGLLLAGCRGLQPSVAPEQPTRAPEVARAGWGVAVHRVGEEGQHDEVFRVVAGDRVVPLAIPAGEVWYATPTRAPASVADADALMTTIAMLGANGLSLRGCDRCGAAVLQRVLERGEKMKLLDLGGTALGDRHAVALGALRELAVLHLDDTAIGDRTVAELAALPQLATLRLDGTKVTSAGLAPLAQRGGLRELGI